MKITIQAILFACLVAVSVADHPEANLRGERELGGRACGRQREESDCEGKYEDGCGWCDLDSGRKARKYGGKCITVGEDDTDDCIGPVKTEVGGPSRMLKKNGGGNGGGGGGGRACGRTLEEDDCVAKIPDGCQWCGLSSGGKKAQKYNGKCITLGESIDECDFVNPDMSKP